MRCTLLASAALLSACFNPAGSSVDTDETSSSSTSTSTSTSTSSSVTSDTTSTSVGTTTDDSTTSSTTSPTEGSTTEATTGGVVDECEPTNPDGTPGCDDDTVVAEDLCYPGAVVTSDLGTTDFIAAATGLFDADMLGDAVFLTNIPSIVVATHDGAGTLTEADERFIDTGGMSSASGAIEVDDFDGDGNVDIALALAPLRRLVLFRSQGNGTFLPLYNEIVIPNIGGAVAQDIEAADIDGDDNIDFVIAGGSALYVAHSDGDFDITTVDSDTTYASSAITAVAVADLDGDGDTDVVHTFTNSIGTLLNDGTGELSGGGVKNLGGAPEGPRRLHLADVSGDGDVDAIVAVGDSVYVLRGNGDGSFQDNNNPLTLSGLSYLAVEDVTADCLVDLVGVVPNGAGDAVELLVYPNLGGGSFVGSSAFDFTAAVDDVVLADMDDDGVPDAVSPIPGGDAVISLSNH